jgi:hypothetical protein
MTLLDVTKVEVDPLPPEFTLTLKSAGVVDRRRNKFWSLNSELGLWE